MASFLGTCSNPLLFVACFCFKNTYAHPKAKKAHNGTAHKGIDYELQVLGQDLQMQLSNTLTDEELKDFTNVAEKVKGIVHKELTAEKLKQLDAMAIKTPETLTDTERALGQEIFDKYMPLAEAELDDKEKE